MAKAVAFRLVVKRLMSIREISDSASGFREFDNACQSVAPSEKSSHLFLENHVETSFVVSEPFVGDF